MRPSRDVFGPTAIAVGGLIAIGIGAAVTTGFVEIRRGSARADSATVTVRTGAGDVEMPTPSTDSARATIPPASAPPTPPALAADTVRVSVAVEDSNSVRPTATELAELASALVTRGHGLLGLQQVRMSLEEFFRHLTTADAAEPAPAATGGLPA